MRPLKKKDGSGDGVQFVLAAFADMCYNYNKLGHKADGCPEKEKKCKDKNV